MNNRGPLPRGPVLGWASFWGPYESPPLGVEGLPHRVSTSSGRAAIYHALRLLGLPNGSGVLAPTYHCPTMIAPIIGAGLRPIFYALDANGMPNLAAIVLS